MSDPRILINVAFMASAEAHNVSVRDLWLARQQKGYRLRLRNAVRRDARRRACYIAMTSLGVRARDLAKALGIRQQSVCEHNRRTAERRAESRRENKILAGIEARLGLAVLE